MSSCCKEVVVGGCSWEKRLLLGVVVVATIGRWRKKSLSTFIAEEVNVVSDDELEVVASGTDDEEIGVFVANGRVGEDEVYD